MEKRLTADLNVVANSNLEIQLLDGDLNIIQKLDDEPNDVGGLTSAELKAKFDESGNIIKKYINETLIPAVLTDDATEESRKQAEAARVAAEQGRVTAEEGRVSAESGRVSAEQARANAEASRVSAETARVQAETARADETAGIVARATAQANAAAGSASQAAGSEQAAQSAANAAGSAASSASQSAATASGSASQAQASAAAAAQSAASVDRVNKTAQSWAVGGTGTRPGEDTNNAKYWAGQAQAAVGGDFATKTEAQGYVTEHNQSVGAHADIRAAVAGSVRYDTAQSLSDAQKTQARTNIGVDGVAAKSIGSVSKSLNASELQAYLDSLPRLLTENHVITLNGTHSQAINIEGFYGCGSITLRAEAVGDCVLHHWVNVTNCAIPVVLQKIKWQEPVEILGAGQSYVTVSSARVFLDNCVLIGSNGGEGQHPGGASAQRFGTLYAADCVFKTLAFCAQTYLGGYVELLTLQEGTLFEDNYAGVSVYYGGIILLTGKTPDTPGSTWNNRNGGLLVGANGKVL